MLSSEVKTMLTEDIKAKFTELEEGSESLYEFLNRYRDWFNAHVKNFEIFLEDNWFEDKTTIEYTIRSLDTFNIKVFAEDEYKNWRDDKTWHLGDYVKTYWTVDDPWGEIETFLKENPEPKAANGHKSR